MATEGTSEEQQNKLRKRATWLLRTAGVLVIGALVAGVWVFFDGGSPQEVQATNSLSVIFPATTNPAIITNSTVSVARSPSTTWSGKAYFVAGIVATICSIAGAFLAGAIFLIQKIDADSALNETVSRLKESEEKLNRTQTELLGIKSDLQKVADQLTVLVPIATIEKAFEMFLAWVSPNGSKKPKKFSWLSGNTAVPFFWSERSRMEILKERLQECTFEVDFCGPQKPLRGKNFEDVTQSNFTENKALNLWRNEIAGTSDDEKKAALLIRIRGEYDAAVADLTRRLQRCAGSHPKVRHARTWRGATWAIMEFEDGALEMLIFANSEAQKRDEQILSVPTVWFSDNDKLVKLALQQIPSQDENE